MASRIHTQGGTNTFKSRVHKALPGPLSQRAWGFPPGSPQAAGQPAKPRPGSGEKVEVCLGEVGVDGGRAQNKTPGTDMDVTAAPPSRWGAWGWTVGPYHRARQVLLPHLVCCPPGAEAGRRSAGPGLSASPRPVQGQGCGRRVSARAVASSQQVQSFQRASCSCRDGATTLRTPGSSATTRPYSSVHSGSRCNEKWPPGPSWSQRC